MYIMSPQERESLKMGIFDPQSIYLLMNHSDITILKIVGTKITIT